MKAISATFAVVIFACAGQSRAADICEAVALHDVPAIGNPAAILRRGERDRAVTQYRVDKKTELTSFCSHGGSCYPTSVMENGHEVEALKLTNCKIGARDPFDDPDEVFYSVDVIRSKIPPKQLKIDDADNRLLDLGLCSACAGNAAYIYVNKPGSRCAKLVRGALAGNPGALDSLKNSPSPCNP